MNDMICPYCGAEWESEIKDARYINKPGEYKCPSCGRIFIMKAVAEVYYYAEKAEPHYKRIVEKNKSIFNLHKKKMIQSIEKEDFKKAKYHQKMMEACYLPDLNRITKKLKKVIKNNKKVGEVDENNKNDCKNL